MYTKNTGVLFPLLFLFNHLIAQSHWPLPGDGLKQHSFLYTGEWDTRHPDAQKMSVIRNGKVIWQYTIPLKPTENIVQEFDDITMLDNGNIVYAQMSGAGIITPEKKIIWKYECKQGTETHSCQPIGKDSVLLALNAPPGQARLIIFNTAINAVLKEIFIPTQVKVTHYQFRHVRITTKHTFMVPILGENRVVEYDMDGKEIWSVKAESPWSAVRLQNGNTLISGDWHSYTREVDPSGKTVWELTQADVPFKLYFNQTANRLKNGNTIICNWVGNVKNTEEWLNSVQVFEVTPDKKVVWALSEWKNPDLGTATSIQLLNSKGLPDENDVQR